MQLTGELRLTGTAAAAPTERTEDLSPGWRVRYRLQPQGDRMVIAGLSIEPTGTVPPGGLTTPDVRQLRLGAARRYAALDRLATAAPHVAKPGRGPGRPQVHTRRFYEHIADRYRALVRASTPAPAKALAAQTIDPSTGRPFARSAMRSILHRCRKLGLFNVAVSVPAGSLAFTGYAPAVEITAAPPRKRTSTRTKGHSHGKQTRKR